jgi:hypothetical protein
MRSTLEYGSGKRTPKSGRFFLQILATVYCFVCALGALSIGLLKEVMLGYVWSRPESVVCKLSVERVDLIAFVSFTPDGRGNFSMTPEVDERKPNDLAKRDFQDPSAGWYSPEAGVLLELARRAEVPVAWASPADLRSIERGVSNVVAKEAKRLQLQPTSGIVAEGRGVDGVAFMVVGANCASSSIQRTPFFEIATRSDHGATGSALVGANLFIEDNDITMRDDRHSSIAIALLAVPPGVGVAFELSVFLGRRCRTRRSHRNELRGATATIDGT